MGESFVRHLPVVERLSCASSPPTVYVRPEVYEMVAQLRGRVDQVRSLPLTIQLSELAEIVEWTIDAFGVTLLVAVGVVELTRSLLERTIRLRRSFRGVAVDVGVGVGTLHRVDARSP